MKRCTVCGEEKPLDRFTQRSNRPAGQLSPNCKDCQSAKTKEWRKRNPGAAERINRERHNRIRREVLTHYSDGDTPRCACCGEDEYVFLALDHVNDDGNVERSAPGFSFARYWTRLWREKPEGYQVLCYNCNWAKRMGGCPHRGEGMVVVR